MQTKSAAGENALRLECMSRVFVRLCGCVVVEMGKRSGQRQSTSSRTNYGRALIISTQPQDFSFAYISVCPDPLNPDSDV
jgi:hypothetical protein